MFLAHLVGDYVWPNQSELASMLGTIRESINKSLGNFRKKNLLRVEPGFITILDLNALKAISS
jgi:CRP-like cAMP-binding protein